MRRRSLVLGLFAGAVALLGVGAVRAAPVETDDLGRGRYAHAKMRLEKTFLKIDVLDLEIHFDQSTADVLESMLKGKKRSKGLEQSVVAAVLRASNAYVGIRFLRNVTFDQFVEGGQANAKRAFEAKLITKAEYLRVRDGLAHWFAPLKKRGVLDGDGFHYRGRPSGLQTVVVDPTGRKVLELKQEGNAPLHTMLASYFAPGSDFREPLFESLFGKS
jgi:hypothetical protein